MNTSQPDHHNTTTAAVSDTVKGAGHWAPGTQTREIEGHFHKENEPKGVEPISEDGGLPNIDFKGIKNALSGHHHEEGNRHAASGQLTSGTQGSGSALGHTDPAHSGSSTLSRDHDASAATHRTQGSTTGATHGISDVAERKIEANSGNHTSGAPLLQEEVPHRNESGRDTHHHGSDSVVKDRESISHPDGSVTGSTVHGSSAAAHSTPHGHHDTTTATKDGSKPSLVDKIKGAIHKDKA